MRPKLELVHVSPQPVTRKPDASRGPSRRALWLAAVTEDSTRLDAKIESRLLADTFRYTRVLLVGFSPEHLYDTRQRLRSIGVAATASASDVQQLHDVSCMDSGFTHVLVNFDAFDDVEAAVETLMTFRPRAPDLIIVACSEVVSGDDVGSERARICDATLKLPVSTPRLIDGLVKAFLNHAGAYRDFTGNG